MSLFRSNRRAVAGRQSHVSEDDLKLADSLMANDSTWHNDMTNRSMRTHSHQDNKIHRHIVENPIYSTATI